MSTIYSPVKINLTLRIFHREQNGYHNIYSLFSRKIAAEKLTIIPLPKDDDNTDDILAVNGAAISGENLVTKIIKSARMKGCNIPPLHITLDKVYPAGSGIGAGSGNAAAMLEWLKKNYQFNINNSDIGKLGADIAFLASGWDSATAEGYGEILTKSTSDLNFVWLLAFPQWKSNTKEAYALLDRYRDECKIPLPIKKPEAQQEAKEILNNLSCGKFCGLLPNDFTDVLFLNYPKYNLLCDLSKSTGALAWSLCGSGSAFFALYSRIEQAYEAQKIFNIKAQNFKTHILE